MKYILWSLFAVVILSAISAYVEALLVSYVPKKPVGLNFKKLACRLITMLAYVGIGFPFIALLYRLPLHLQLQILRFKSIVLAIKACNMRFASEKLLLKNKYLILEHGNMLPESGRRESILNCGKNCFNCAHNKPY